MSEEAAGIEPHVLIAVATYRRPEGLKRLLTSIDRSQSASAYSIVVVDNDRAESARPSVDESVTYLVEPRAGIAAARNAGLRVFYANAAFTHIAFVDDDEAVCRSWIDLLLETLGDGGADVVSGPVVPELVDDLPKVLVKGGYLDRARFPTGATVRIAATNNTVVSRNMLERAGRPVFSESFSLSGGSDTEFFTRLREAGAHFVWDDRAVATETVAMDRATLAWALKRQRRVGGVAGRLIVERSGRLALLPGSVVRILAGAVKIFGDLLMGRGFRASSTGTLMHGIGMLDVMKGKWVVEYSRVQGGA